MLKETIATVCFPLRSEEVLLGMKKRGFGAGWWNGFGGKLQEGEMIRTAVLRELAEESGLRAHEKDLFEVARMRFFLPDGAIMAGHAFLLTAWSGEPQETEEMRPQWFPIQEVPYETMWPGDNLWLPEIFKGNKVQGEIRFGATTAEVRSHKVESGTF